MGEAQFASAGILTPEDILANQLHYSITHIANETQVFEKYRPSEIGFFFGTSTADTYPLLSKIDQMFEDKSNHLYSYLTNKNTHGFLVKQMKEFFPIGGLDATFATACSSAATAIAEGFYALNTGLVKACFVGGFDILNPITICGFHALQILDTNFTVPFAKQRKGINLSEGGALFLLEKTGAVSHENVYAFLKGVGGSSDAYHMTKPEPNGFGAELSMKNALSCANMSAENIDYINAHGTGTESNDAAETFAIERLFKNQTYISSTKSLHGHALGGSSSLEMAVCLAALQTQKMWCGLFENNDYDDEILHVKKPLIGKPLNTILSNSFGFGGTNMSLIFSRDKG